MNFKKRTNFLFGVLLLTGSLLAQNVCVSTPKTSLVLSAPEGGTLRHLYYGNRLSGSRLAEYLCGRSEPCSLSRIWIECSPWRRPSL